MYTQSAHTHTPCECLPACFALSYASDIGHQIFVLAIEFCENLRDPDLNFVCSSFNLPEIMKQMPPLPVKLNEDLANSVLL